MADYAQNTLLQVDDGGGINFTTVVEVLDIEGPGIEREEIDTTSHDVSDGFRRFVAGLADPGEVSFEIQYMMGSATHQTIETLIDSGAVRSFRLIPPVGGRRWNFTGFFKSFSPSFPVGDKQTAAVTVRVTAKPTRTAHP